MPLPSTMTPIATNTLTAAGATVTFSSVPQTYTDLVLVFNGAATSGAANFLCTVNGDTGSNYSRTAISGNGTTAFSGRYSTQTLMMLNEYGFINTTFSNIVANFMNYSNTTTYKNVLSRPNNADNGTSAVINLWRSTSAINTISISISASTFAIGSTFTLYGIKAA